MSTGAVILRFACLNAIQLLCMFGARASPCQYEALCTGSDRVFFLDAHDDTLTQAQNVLLYACCMHPFSADHSGQVRVNIVRKAIERREHKSAPHQASIAYW